MTFVSFMAYSQTKVQLSVGDKSMTASLADNGATHALIDLLASGPITIRMSDYGGFEKVGALPQSLPTSNTQITTVPGDIMLYQGNNMVIFYGSNTWSYTPLGKINGATASTIKQFLGAGDITLTLSLDSSSFLESVTSDTEEKIFDIKGNPAARPLAPGLYIINGHKTLIK